MERKAARSLGDMALMLSLSLGRSGLPCLEEALEGALEDAPEAGLEWGGDASFALRAGLAMAARADAATSLDPELGLTEVLGAGAGAAEAESSSNRPARAASVRATPAGEDRPEEVLEAIAGSAIKGARGEGCME